MWHILLEDFILELQHDLLTLTCMQIKLFLAMTYCAAKINLPTNYLTAWCVCQIRWLPE